MFNFELQQSHTEYYFFQTPSYGGCSTEERKPDLQCRRKACFSQLQPRRAGQEGGQNIVTVPRDGSQSHSRQRLKRKRKKKIDGIGFNLTIDPKRKQKKKKEKR